MPAGCDRHDQCHLVVSAPLFLEREAEASQKLSEGEAEPVRNGEYVEVADDIGLPVDENRNS